MVSSGLLRRVALVRTDSYLLVVLHLQCRAVLRKMEIIFNMTDKLSVLCSRSFCFELMSDTLSVSLFQFLSSEKACNIDNNAKGFL
jgi:hypothetical protein